jgi:hypothetical protein
VFWHILFSIIFEDYLESKTGKGWPCQYRVVLPLGVISFYCICMIYDGKKLTLMCKVCILNVLYIWQPGTSVYIRLITYLCPRSGHSPACFSKIIESQRVTCCGYVNFPFNTISNLQMWKTSKTTKYFSENNYLWVRTWFFDIC